MTTNYKLQTTNYSHGFTLAETMVAITILMIAVVGPMSAIGGSLSQIRTARDQIIAVNLAQEGIEAVRQKRDSNMLNRWINPPKDDKYWRSGIKNDKNYIVIVPVLELYECSGVSCSSEKKEIYQTSIGSYYQSSTGMIAGDTKTQFSREVIIAPISGSGQEIQITSTVTWIAQGVIKTVEVKESLFGISS